MYRGTTPTHRFKVNIDPTLFKTIKITYTQNNEEILVKRTEDCTIEGGVVSVKLTQEETFLFKSDALVNIQMRVITSNGDALVSAPITTIVKKCLDEEILV